MKQFSSVVGIVAISTTLSATFALAAPITISFEDPAGPGNPISLTGNAGSGGLSYSFTDVTGDRAGVTLTATGTSKNPIATQKSPTLSNIGLGISGNITGDAYPTFSFQTTGGYDIDRRISSKYEHLGFGLSNVPTDYVITALKLTIQGTPTGGLSIDGFNTGGVRGPTGFAMPSAVSMLSNGYGTATLDITDIYTQQSLNDFAPYTASNVPYAVGIRLFPELDDFDNSKGFWISGVTLNNKANVFATPPLPPAVPLPAGGLLLLSGIGGMAFARRRATRKNAARQA